MKRTLLTLAILAGILGSAHPAAAATTTITARGFGVDGGRYEDCGATLTISGQLTPKNATPRVALQRTVNGRWVDWVWYTSKHDRTASRIFATVDPTYGNYSLTLLVPRSAGRTYSLRVRSNGGSVWSNTVWLTASDISGTTCA